MDLESLSSRRTLLLPTFYRDRSVDAVKQGGGLVVGGGARRLACRQHDIIDKDGLVELDIGLCLILGHPRPVDEVHHFGRRRRVHVHVVVQLNRPLIRVLPPPTTTDFRKAAFSVSSLAHGAFIPSTWKETFLGWGTSGTWKSERTMRVE